MMTLCKTIKGTLAAWSFGNRWFDSDTENKGVAIGVYDGSAYAELKYLPEKDKYLLTVNINNAVEDGVEVIIKEKEDL